MEEGEKKPGAGPLAGIPQKKIEYAVLAIAVVILAVVVIAKFGYNTDLLNPTGGQMSLVRQNLSYKVTTPPFQRVITPIPRLCPAGTTGCSGTCVNLSTDDRNCGACGNTCNVTTGAFCNRAGCYNPGSDPLCSGVVCQWGSTSCCAGRCVLNTNLPNHNCAGGW